MNLEACTRPTTLAAFIHTEASRSLERPFKGPCKRCNSLTDAGSNPGNGTRWWEKNPSRAIYSEHVNTGKYSLWEAERKKTKINISFFAAAAADLQKLIPISFFKLIPISWFRCQ